MPSHTFAYLEGELGGVCVDREFFRQLGTNADVIVELHQPVQMRATAAIRQAVGYQARVQGVGWAVGAPTNF